MHSHKLGKDRDRGRPTGLYSENGRLPNMAYCDTKNRTVAVTFIHHHHHSAASYGYNECTCEGTTHFLPFSVALLRWAHATYIGQSFIRAIKSTN